MIKIKTLYCQGCNFCIISGKFFTFFGWGIELLKITYIKAICNAALPTEDNNLYQNWLYSISYRHDGWAIPSG